MTSTKPDTEVHAHRLTSDFVLAGRDLTLIPNGAVDVGGDGRIVKVGSQSEMGPPPGPVRDVGGLLMPGLVNAHAHTPMTLVRSVGDGMALGEWLAEGVWPREGRMTPEDAWWGMVVGSMEMLEAGVTTSCEMYLFEDEVVDAAGRTGARLVVTPGLIAALSRDGNIEQRLSDVVDFHKLHHDPDRRVSVGFGPHSVYDLTPDQCGQIATEAAARDAVVHIHLEETEAERKLLMERYGTSATKALAEAGVFEAKVLAAHGVWLDRGDRTILADADASVAHCPMSNLKLGSGIAPLVDLLAEGVNVGVATDGPASNDNLDLWEELKLAPLLARGTTHNPQALSATSALKLATSSAATAVGLDDVGHLSPGARADIIRVDLDQPAFQPLEDLTAQLVFAGSSRWVTDVWVDGHQLVHAGRLQSIDREQALAEVAERGRRLARSG